MPTVNEIHIGGSVSYKEGAKGSLSNKLNVRSGSLINKMGIEGAGSIPKIINRSQIHYDTTANWNSQIDLVGEEGHIYVYSDYTTKEIEEGGEIKTVNIPAIKIGDGLAYLIDTPFIATGESQDFIDHINNLSIHVMPTDRTNWDEKVSADVDGDMLVLSL